MLVVAKPEKEKKKKKNTNLDQNMSKLSRRIISRWLRGTRAVSLL